MATTIFTFLSDQYQHEIKQQAEIGAERFEVVMKNYKNIFWSEFASLSHISNCIELNPKIEHLTSANKKNLQTWLDCFYKTISASTTQLQTFFDELIEIYETYIQGNLTLASEKFNILLTNHNLYNSASDFEKYYPITFRGRINNPYNGYNPFKYIHNFINRLVCKSKKPIDYFYHIPFNKLHFIKNYRFSLSGQPFIYLGASIPTVLLELRSDLNKIKNIELSSWGIKPNEHLRMYDISNSLYDLINLNIIPIFNAGTGITCQDNHITPNISIFVTEFKKFIISQFCTFKKKDFDGQIFIQQYVLPQLLTEQIRNYKKIKYDGFIFPSTQYLDRVSTKDKEIYYGLFKNNIALFTHYSPTDNYDNNLISRFDISTIDKSENMTDNDFIQESNKIKYSAISKTLIKIKLEQLKDYYKKMKIDNIALTELKSIKIQFSSMLNYIKRLKKNELEKARPLTKNIVHLADSTKNQDDSNKQT